MNDTTIEAIANKLNISKSMVSRVLRHCGGADSETRHRILSETHGVIPQKQSDCSIYVIFPDTPQYFWKPLRTGISTALKATNIAFKCNIYTKASDETTVLTYLDEAERLNARAIILSTHITPAIHQKLESMIDGRLVILLSEYHELKNSFYIGSDAYSEGYFMGKHYVSHYESHYAGRQFLLLSRKSNINVIKRIDGFYQAVNEEHPELLKNALRIELDNKIFNDFKLLPSKLAPLLVEAARPYERLCIYSPVGLPQFPLAIIKAKLTDKTVCLCHDCYTEHPYPEKNLDNGFVVTCNQDGLEQGLIAAKLAIDYVEHSLYPLHKRTYIPSHLNVAIKYDEDIAHIGSIANQ